MPTIRRQLVDGPSREDLFDSLRLGTRVHFDVAVGTPSPDVLGVGDSASKTESQLLWIALMHIPSFSSFVTSIGMLDRAKNRWIVEADFEESRYTKNRMILLSIDDYNTRNRRESGVLVVSWEDDDAADTVLNK